MHYPLCYGEDAVTSYNLPQSPHLDPSEGLYLPAGAIIADAFVAGGVLPAMVGRRMLRLRDRLILVVRVIVVDI